MSLARCAEELRAEIKKTQEMADDTEARFKSLSRDHAEVTQALEDAHRRLEVWLRCGRARDNRQSCANSGVLRVPQDERERMAACQRDLAEKTDEVHQVRQEAAVESEVCGPRCAFPLWTRNSMTEACRGVQRLKAKFKELLEMEKEEMFKYHDEKLRAAERRCEEWVEEQAAAMATQCEEKIHHEREELLQQCIGRIRHERSRMIERTSGYKSQVCTGRGSVSPVLCLTVVALQCENYIRRLRASGALRQDPGPIPKPPAADKDTCVCHVGAP